MTTIAWRGRTLAADTQLTLGDDINVRCRKLQLIKGHGCLAVSGNIDAEWFFKKWFLAGEKTSDFDWKRAKKFDAIHADQWKDIWWYDDSPARLPVEHEFHAIGSGSKSAMAAMHLGATAREAVEFASETDPHTNDMIDTYDLQTGKLALCRWPPLSRHRWQGSKLSLP